MAHWTLRHILKRAGEVLREEGLKALCFKILGETVYRRAALMERRFEDPLPVIQACIPVAISLLSESEAEEYARFRPDTDPMEVRRRLAGGHLCFVARYEGHMVHACWASAGHARITYLDLDVLLAPEEVYFYEGFTSPDFRGRNIASVVRSEMIRFFRQAGYRRLLSVIMPENRSAFRPAEKLGYRRIGTIGYVKLGPWRHTFWRFRSGATPPGQQQSGTKASLVPTYWDSVFRRSRDGPLYLDSFLGSLKREAHLKLIERWGKARPWGRVLKTDLFEEATGPGAFLMDLCADCATVMGMDVSPAIVAQAQARDAGRRAHYVVADARRLPFAHESFALIVSPSTLDHFGDPSDLDLSLRELARVLEPQGTLIITLDNRQNIFDPLLRLIARLGWTPYYLGRSYSVGELCAALEAAGFIVQDTTAILHNPRLVAVAAVTVANRLRWPALIRLVHRALMAAQRLEHTRWRYRTGSFVAVQATRQ